MGFLSLTFLDLSILLSDLSILGSFVALYLQVKSRKSALGLSLQTVGAVAAARLLHLFSHPIGIHFRPDTLPFWLFALLDYANAGFGLFVVYFIFANYMNTYEAEKDNFSQNFWLKLGVSKDVVSKLKWAFIYIIAALLGLVWHFVRRSHHSLGVSFFCCYYEVLCAIAILPQLWMFQQDRVVSPQLANFVALTAANRLFTLVFWVSYPYVFWNRYPDNRGVQMASEVLNLIILSDFLYYFIRARMRGQKVVVIPHGMNEV
jgi:hypothetical protein